MMYFIFKYNVMHIFLKIIIKFKNEHVKLVIEPNYNLPGS